MPLNVRRFCMSIFLVLFGLVTFSFSQTVTSSPAVANVTPPAAVIQQAPIAGPTSGDIMRERISKAKAYIVVRNYNAAIYELENIRKETGDQAVQGVVNVLLMNSYLEQGDFKRAQDMLTEFYNIQKTTKPNAMASYLAVAGQVVKGARTRVERYKALGLNITDRTLPLEALNDLEKMRETVELVITQSKDIGKMPAKTTDAMMMLEEAASSRSMIGRDDYDARHWRDEVADTREQMANSRSVVRSAVNDPNASPVTETVAENKPAPPPVTQQASNPPANTASREREVADNDKPAYVPLTQQQSQPQQQQQSQPQLQQQPQQQPVAEKPKTPVEDSKPRVMVPNAAPATTESTTAATTDNATAATTGNVSPLDVGSLVAYATNQPPPVYPAAAKTMRTSGTVRVDVTVDEKGDVIVDKTTGPTLLQNAAKDAIKKWKFKPFVRDGQPVKATGFVSFNFNL